MKQINIFMYYLIILFVILLNSCNNNNSLTIIKVSEIGATRISDTALAEVIREELGFKINLQFSNSEDTALYKIREGKADLAIIPNNAEQINYHGESTRTIIPLLPRILIVLTKQDIDINKDVSNIMKGKKVGFEPMDLTDSLFFRELQLHYKIDIDSFTPVIIQNDEDMMAKINEVDIFITLSHLRNPLVHELLDHNYSIYSIGDILLYNRGSSVDGFCLGYPRAYPFILPKGVYDGYPKEPILTIAVQDILICNENMDKDLVYDITRTIVEKKAYLAQKNKIYGLMNFNFDRGTLSFPMHQGSTDYFNKDAPTFMERYAELIGVILSIIVFIGGIMISLARKWYLKKEKIHHYFNKIREIRERSSNDPDKAMFLQEMIDIREKGVQAMMHEKLDANESFQIFLDLCDKYIGEMSPGGKES